MKAEELFDLIGEVDEKKVQESIMPVKRSGKTLWIKIGAAAACLCVVLTTGAVAADARAYNEAVDFFQEYGLSTEGLTRMEIKAVYRDITTKTYSYSKTADVIQRNISAGFSGTEIAQDEPAPQDIAELWEQIKATENKGVHYRPDYLYRQDEALGFSVHAKSILQKFDGNKLLWNVSFTEFYMEKWTEVSGGVLVWGYTPTWSSAQRANAWLAKVDDRGDILWKTELPHDFQREYIAGVLENGDGTYAVLSRGDLKFLVLSQYSPDGTEISTHKTEVGNEGIWNIARLGEDYIVQLGNKSTNVERIVRVDQDGNLTDAFAYTSEDCYYYITDMAEFAGKLYLSAYSVPRLSDEGDNAGTRYDIAAVLKYIDDNNLNQYNETPPSDNDNLYSEIPNEVLLPLLRNHYTAVLLVCDPSEGTPQTYYSVQGSLGGKLTAGDELAWDVESFSSAVYCSFTSAWTISGTCQVFRYSFDTNGTLLSQEKTDEVTTFAR